MDIFINALLYMAILTVILLVSIFLGTITGNYILKQKKKKEKRKKRKEQEKVFYNLIDQTQFNSEVHDE